MSFSIISKSLPVILINLLIWLGHVSAQYNVIGEVLSDGHLPVAHLQVSIIKPSDSSIITSSSTTLDGKYKLGVKDTGNYVISVKSAFYQHLKLAIQVKKAITDVPPIYLIPVAVNLRGVNVSSNRPLYQREIDRIVVNLGNQQTLVSGSVLDVLEKLPGVKVNRETSSISLNGKEEVGIMQEGKIVNIPLSSFIQTLGTMEAGNIKQIELITTPPAKYEAGNAGGLINIIMNKRTTDGYNGAYTAALGYGDFDKEKLAMNLSIRQKRISFFGDISYNKDKSYRRFENYKTIATPESNYSTSTLSSRFPISKNYSARFGLDLYLNDKVTIGSSVYGLINTWDQHVNSRGEIFLPPDSIINLSIFNAENSSKTMLTGNIDLSYQINKKSNLYLDVDYLYFFNKNPNLYENTYTYTNHQFLKDVFTSEKRTPVNIWAGKVDYSTQISASVQLETGYKSTFTSLDNQINISDMVERGNGIGLPLGERSNLNEVILAVYATSKWRINEKMSLHAGLRYENSVTKLTIPQQKQAVNRNLSKLFPSLFLSKTLSPSSTLILSYGRRINRPTYNDLAPFILFLDPTTLYNGNISLKPSLSNIYTLTYNFKKYSLSTEFIDSADPIFRFQPVLAENNKQVFMPINLKSNKIFSGLLSAPFKLADFWQMDNFIQGVLQSNQFLNEKRLSDSYYRIRSTQNFSLPKQYFIQVFASYQSSRLTGASRTSSSNKVDFAIDKKWPASNDRLQLSINNIFSDRYYVSSISDDAPGFYALTDYKYESRIIRLAYSHTFGNTKLKAQRKSNKAIDEIEERVIK